MTERELDVVRRMFDAFAARDVATLIQLLHPDMEFNATATAELAGREGPYRGHAGIQMYFDDVERVWDELTVEPVDTRAVAGSVVIFGRVRGVRAGETLHTGAVWTWRLRDGLVVAGSVAPTPDMPQPRPADPSVPQGDPAPPAG